MKVSPAQHEGMGKPVCLANASLTGHKAFHIETGYPGCFLPGRPGERVGKIQQHFDQALYGQYRTSHSIQLTLWTQLGTNVSLGRRKPVSAVASNRDKLDTDGCLVRFTSQPAE
jgi:hypothetical protein